jgi:hypothetical protein
MKSLVLARRKATRMTDRRREGVQVAQIAIEDLKISSSLSSVSLLMTELF